VTPLEVRSIGGALEMLAVITVFFAVTDTRRLLGQPALVKRASASSRRGCGALAFVCTS
jgi:hypothetical protein